jgi:hypothetical protein
MERNVIDIIQAVVTSMSTPAPTFVYGDMNEVVQKIHLLSQTPALNAARYPLIAMFTDVTEQKGNQAGIQASITIAHILFVHVTIKNYHAEQRKEKVFKPVLQPMYELFLQKLAESTAVQSIDWKQIKHNKTDRYSWGKSAFFQDNNLTVENCDAIHVEQLQISVLRKKQC